MDNAASTQESRRLAYRAARPPLKLHSPRSLPFSPAPCTPRLAEVAALDGHATLSTMAQPSEPYPRRPGPPERVAAERAARAPGLSSRAWQVLELRGQLAEKEAALDGVRAALAAARRALAGRAAAAEATRAARAAAAAASAGRDEALCGELAAAEAVRGAGVGVSRRKPGIRSVWHAPHVLFA